MLTYWRNNMVAKSQPMSPPETATVNPTEVELKKGYQKYQSKSYGIKNIYAHARSPQFLH
jgi:hypothetical protein